MKPYLFTSKRLSYRKTTENDIEIVLSIENNDENIKYIIPRSREQLMNALNDPDKKHLVIEDNDEKQVGYLMLAGLKIPCNNVELVRITISDKAKGYGREAMKAIMKFTFDNIHAHRLWLDVKEYNERAKQIYLSLGFIQEGMLRESIKNGDKYESLIIMSVLKHEFSQFKEGRGFS